MLLVRAIRDGIERVLLPALAGEHRLLPVVALERSGLTARAIAARRDRLRAVNENGRWYATRGAIDDYLASRWRRT